MDKLQRVINFAFAAHAGQFRKESGLPYIFHPMSVANKLSKIGIFEPKMIAAALLHDVMEDCYITVMDMEPMLNDIFSTKEADEIIGWVKELTYVETEQTKSEYMDYFAGASVEALVIKVLDRIDNVEDYFATNPAYAAKYYFKANPLFASQYTRGHEIEEKFGRRVAMLLDQLVTETRNKLGQRN